MKRFWDKVKIAGPDECWEWQAGTYLKGLKYGRFQFEGKARTAHRIAYMLTKGEIPEGLFVCHACDNPKCCNPTHLWLGTAKDNTKDMLKKGRGSGGNMIKTHCKNGHEYDMLVKNDRTKSGFTRKCRACHNANMRDWYRRKMQQLDGVKLT